MKTPGKTLRCLYVVSIIALTAVLSPSAADAFSIDDYFTYTYSMQLNQTEIFGSEPFTATVSGVAVCKKDLPMSPSEASITTRVVAQNQDTGVVVVLNPGYTVTLNPVPSKEGQSAERNITVPLSFPAGCQSGDYVILGDLTEARIKVIIWLDITGLLPQSQTIGAMNYTSPDSEEPEEDDNGDDLTTTAAISLTEYTDENGRFIREFSVQSVDGRFTLIIPQGTIGRSAQGDPLDSIAIVPVEEPPVSPAGYSILGQVYETRPNGATFEPPIILRFDYDDDWIPQGIREERPVIVFRDSEADEWTLLNCNVDTGSNTVTTAVTHFSEYAIVIPARPATFTYSEIDLEPDKAGPGQTVVVSVFVSNTGDIEGRRTVEMRIDGVVFVTRDVYLAGNTGKRVDFAVSLEETGIHEVDIANLTSTLTITPDISTPLPADFTISDLNISPVLLTPGESIVISALVTNTGEFDGSYQLELLVGGDLIASETVTLGIGESRVVTFDWVGTSAGTHAVNVGNVSGNYTVVAETEPATTSPDVATSSRKVSWWWIGGSIIAGIILGTAAALAVLRRRRSS